MSRADIVLLLLSEYESISIVVFKMFYLSTRGTIEETS